MWYWANCSRYRNIRSSIIMMTLFLVKLYTVRYCESPKDTEHSYCNTYSGDIIENCGFVFWHVASCYDCWLTFSCWNVLKRTLNALYSLDTAMTTKSTVSLLPSVFVSTPYKLKAENEQCWLTVETLHVQCWLTVETLHVQCWLTVETLHVQCWLTVETLH